MPLHHPILASANEMSTDDYEWFHRVVTDWHLMADLAFSDYIMWLPTPEGWRVAAHARPATGAMTYVDEMVGRAPDSDLSIQLHRALSARERVEFRPRNMNGVRVKDRAFPIVRGDAVIAIITRHTNLTHRPWEGDLERAYLSIAARLEDMVQSGAWPQVGQHHSIGRGSPRVGDGILELDATGVVTFSSPNAVSALRRLGYADPVVGARLIDIARTKLSGQVLDPALRAALTGSEPSRAEMEVGGACAIVRSIPLIASGVHQGALVLIRDISELRRREHELMSKDETIREIHHRVKNNLQTVAALLRLQARRVDDLAGKTALGEAVRRVDTIAMVYETLSWGSGEIVDFDEIATRGLNAIVDLATREYPVTTSVAGTFGAMLAEDATAVALILSEIISNAAEHGIANESCQIDVAIERRAGADESARDHLAIQVRDHGPGLPQGFRPGRASLGTRIVTSLVQDLDGTIRWEDANPGTLVAIQARIHAIHPAKVGQQPTADDAVLGRRHPKKQQPL